MIKLKKMTVPQMVGQLFMIRINPNELSSNSERDKIARKYFSEFQPGGVFIHGGSPERILATTNWLQSISDIPLWIAADVERGIKGISSGGTSIPHGALLGATHDAQTVYELYSVVAKECRALGINMAFAPVVDLLNENPIINIRAFHSEPEWVENLATSAIQALLDGGIVPVIKHFPGHALVDEDTHAKPGRINQDHPQLEEQQNVFIKLLNRFPRIAIMTSHMIIPPDEAPLTFSGRLPGEDELHRGSKPLWITDDLSMGGAEFKTKQPRAKQLLRNNHHIWLNPPNHALLFAQLEGLIQKDDTSFHILEERVKRILKYKTDYLKQNRLTGSLQKIYKNVGISKHRGLTIEAAAKGIVPIRNNHTVVDNRSLLHVIICPEGQENSALIRFRRHLSQYFGLVKEYVNEIPEPVNATRVIVSVYQRTFANCQTIQFSEKRIQALQKLAAELPVTLLFWGNMLPFIRLAEQLNTSMFWIPSYMDEVQLAMVDILKGRRYAGGRLPISLTPNWPVGFSTPPQTEYGGFRWHVMNHDTLYKLLSENVGTAFTGAVAANLDFTDARVQVWKVGKPKNEHHQYIDADELVFWDVASLTKILATTPLVLQLISRGALHFHTTLGELFVELNETQKAISIRQILAHQAGYDAWLPLHEKVADKHEAITSILSRKTAYPPGTRTQYSDLGFIILGKIIELLHGKSLNLIFRDEIAKPLGLAPDMFYYYPRILQTQKCVLATPDYSLSKGKYGLINDRNAELFPNGAGHAGIMSNLKGLISWLQNFLDGSLWNVLQVSESVLETSFKKEEATDGSTHALGWDMPEKPSQAGTYYEKSTLCVGHLAFTGCSCWVDLAEKKASVLLSNRGFTEYSTEEFRQLRRKIFTLLGNSFGN